MPSQVFAVVAVGSLLTAIRLARRIDLLTRRIYIPVGDPS
jgi:hypothetical protein